MSKGSKLSRQKEVLSKNLAALKEQIKLIDTKLDERVPNRFHHDQQGPIVNLDSWMRDNKESLDKVKEPVGNSVLLVKIVLEGLSSGPMTEKDLRLRVSDTCKFMGVRSTSRGTITGLAIDISTICGVLQCLGLIEAVTIAPSASYEKRPQSALQRFREEVREMSIQASSSSPSAAVASEASKEDKIGTGNLENGREKVSEATQNGGDASRGIRATQGDREGSHCEGKGEAQQLVEDALRGLSLEDFDAIVTTELELLAAECRGHERMALPSSTSSTTAVTVAEASSSRLGLELVRSITEENRAILVALYKDAREYHQRMELKTREKGTKKIAKKATTTKADTTKAATIAPVSSAVADASVGSNTALGGTAEMGREDAHSSSSSSPLQQGGANKMTTQTAQGPPEAPASAPAPLPTFPNAAAAFAAPASAYTAQAQAAPTSVTSSGNTGHGSTAGSSGLDPGERSGEKPLKDSIKKPSALKGWQLRTLDQVASDIVGDTASELVGADDGGAGRGSKKGTKKKYKSASSSLSLSRDREAMDVDEGSGTAQNTPVKGTFPPAGSPSVKLEEANSASAQVDVPSFNFREEAKGIMCTWMETCHEEGALLELEERLLRRLAGQCNLNLEQGRYRKGTLFLADGHWKKRSDSSGNVGESGGGGYNSNFSFKEGYLFTANSLWYKGRIRHQKRSAARVASGVAHVLPASSTRLPAMPVAHPHVQNGLIGDTFNYDLHCVNLHNHRKAEAARQEARGGAFGSSRHRGRGASLGLELGPTSSNTYGLSTGRSEPTVSGSTSSTQPITVQGIHVNPRYSLPVAWNRGDHITQINHEMQLQGPLFATTSVLDQKGPSANLADATIVKPDLVLHTTEVPWKMMANEFEVLTAADEMELSGKDLFTTVSPRGQYKGLFSPRLSASGRSHRESPRTAGSGVNSSGGLSGTGGSGGHSALAGVMQSDNTRISAGSGSLSTGTGGSMGPLSGGTEPSEAVRGGARGGGSGGALNVSGESDQFSSPRVPNKKRKAHGDIAYPQEEGVPNDLFANDDGTSAGVEISELGQNDGLRVNTEQANRDHAYGEGEQRLEEPSEYDKANRQRSMSSASLGLSAAALKDVSIEAPQFIEVGYDLQKEAIAFRQQCEQDASFEAQNAPAEGSTEDVSDEAVLARHESVLGTMRTRWDKLKKLKAERKEIIGETESAFSGRSAFFHNRSPKRGSNKRNKSGGSSKFRGNAGTIAAQAAAAARAAARALAASNPGMASPYYTKAPPVVPSVTRAVTRRGTKEAAANDAQKTTPTSNEMSSMGEQTIEVVQDSAVTGGVVVGDAGGASPSSHVEVDIQEARPSVFSMMGEEVRVRSNTLTSNSSEGAQAGDKYHTLKVVDEKSD